MTNTAFGAYYLITHGMDAMFRSSRSWGDKMTALVITTIIVTLVASGAWWYLVLFTTAKDPDVEDLDDPPAPTNQNPAEQ